MKVTLGPFNIHRRMDKENVAHIYNGILLSHKKEWNWVICRDVCEARDCHTEWIRSEREKKYTLSIYVECRKMV